MTKKENFHGSDLEKIQEVYGIKKEEIVQFAANVNPLGISPMMRKQLETHIDAVSNYPDRDYLELRKSIGEYTHTDPAHILVGNGSTELISLMAQFIHPRSALIIAPTYSEYEREIGISGGSIKYFQLQEEQNFQLNLDDLETELKNRYDMLVICNPNNPTSSFISHDEMKKILTYCKKYKTFVMIDETYVEFSPNYEEITSVSFCDKFNNFVVLRGVSKFYAAPGLRLGYAITGNLELIQLVNAKKNPWTINSLAEQAGIVMFTDEAYNQETKELMHSEQTRIYKIFSESEQYKPYLPSANFILLKIVDETLNADMLFERAIKEKMMIRNCSSFPFLDNQYIRFCFMTPEENDKLIKLLLEK